MKTAPSAPVIVRCQKAATPRAWKLDASAMQMEARRSKHSLEDEKNNLEFQGATVFHKPSAGTDDRVKTLLLEWKANLGTYTRAFLGWRNFSNAKQANKITSFS